jgi:hypothetical protein
MDQGLITTIAMGIALSATAGFRVFVPMLAAAVSGHFNIIHLPPDMGWLSSWTSIICFATAAVAEIAAYYIPFIDNLLDTIATPLSVAAGTLLAFSILPLSGQEPIVRWGLAFLAGGSTAGTIQLGTGLLRLLSSKATIGTGNAVVATTENAAAVTSTLLSFVIPVMVALLLLILCVWVVARLFKRITRRRPL